MLHTLHFTIRPAVIYLLLLLFSSVPHTADSQSWVNPSDRHADAHKKYAYARCPIGSDSLHHFVYFARDRKSIKDHPMLFHSRLDGAQIMYSWRDLEPSKGKYDFSKIIEDLDYLNSFGKKLFIQLQDVTFYSKYKAIPEYLFSQEYDGGAVERITDRGHPEGWVAKRWNSKVRSRFALLVKELGKQLDGRIEGINLQETAIGINPKIDKSFSEKAYVEELKKYMKVLRHAFSNTTTMIYANFMPGEWLPWEDKGYLKEIYRYGNEIGVGLGAPDLMPTRKGQLNHALAMMHEESYSVPLGIAVQDGNYIGITGADGDYDHNISKLNRDRPNLVPMLYEFAKEFLRVDYMFWANQDPFIEEDVLSCFSK